jgi:hypothetical protein
MGPREMDKLAEQVALTIDKALSPHSDNPQEFVKDLSLIHDFLAKQIPECLKGHSISVKHSVMKVEGGEG